MNSFWFTASLASNLSFRTLQADPPAADTARCQEATELRDDGLFRYGVLIEDPAMITALIDEAGGWEERSRPLLLIRTREVLRTDAAGSAWTSDGLGECPGCVARFSIRDSAGRTLVFEESLGLAAERTSHFAAWTTTTRERVASPLTQWARQATPQTVRWVEISVEMGGVAAVDCAEGAAAARWEVAGVDLRYGR